MTSKITCLYTRPKQWVKLKSDVLDLHYIPPAKVLKLRNGKVTTDCMGTVFDRQGLDSLVATFKKVKPDVFLFWTHFGPFFDKKFLKSLKGLSSKTIFIQGSGNQVMNERGRDWYVERIRKFIDVYMINTTDEKKITLLRENVPVVYTMYDSAVDPDEFTAPSGPHKIDCFFGGGNTVGPSRPRGRFPNSLERCKFITNVMESHKTVLRGAGWKTAKGGLMDLAYFRDMQRAKIVLGFNHYDLKKYYTKRTIYSGTSGRLLVTKYIPGMELDGLKDGANVVWFRTVEEGLGKVAYYLEHDDERERIAKAQRTYFIKHHSWEARLRMFEGVVKKVVGR